MTTSLLDAIERPPICGTDRVRRPGRGDCGRDRPARPGAGALPAVGGAPTLDDLLTATWESVTAGRDAVCPLCEAPLELRYGAGHAPVAGRCTRCATELA